MAQGSVTFNSNKKRKKSPEKRTVDKDARSAKTAGEYPNYMCWKDRCGNSLSFDYSKGTETVTIQHRSGSAIQMRPDGGVHYTSHNGQYNVIFGENFVTISGAQDITVKGDASFRVYGDYNTTVHGDYNLAVMGDLNITAKNKNQLIRGNKDTIAMNETKKLSGSSSGTYLGGYARTAKDAVSVISHSNQSYVGGGAGSHVATTNEGPQTFSNEKGDTVHENKDGKRAVNVESNNKKVYTVADGGKFSVKADDRINVKGEKEGKFEFNNELGLKSTTSGINVDAPSGSFQATAGQKVRVSAGSDMQMKSGGTAGFEGATTHVGGQTGTTHVVGGAVNVEPLAGLLNLAGGLGIPMPNMSQLSFNFGDLLEQIPMPDIAGGGAAPSTSEPDATSWTSRLA